MEVPRLGVESELQLPAYAMVTATPGLSQIFDLHQSSWQCQILNSLSRATDRICILMDTSWVHLPQKEFETSQLEGRAFKEGENPEWEWGRVWGWGKAPAQPRLLGPS